MKRKIISIYVLSLLILSSCGTNSTNTNETTTQETTLPPLTIITTESITEVLTEHETAPQQEVGFEGMTEINGEELNNGEYHINVDSSSSMFKIADCILYVNDGDINADIIINSKSYDKLFMGTEDEAKNSSDAECIGYTVNDQDQSVFRVPVNALDKEIQCAALSAKKQEWYGRTLVFRADSLPDEAFKENRFTNLLDLNLENGEYTISAYLEGGSGRASIESPTKLKIENNHAIATITWSSDKYDKMVVKDETYTPNIIDGHSVFEIDILGFDYKMSFSANTTAMSTPHMIDYTINFDSSTIKKCE